MSDKDQEIQDITNILTALDACGSTSFPICWDSLYRYCDIINTILGMCYDVNGAVYYYINTPSGDYDSCQITIDSSEHRPARMQPLIANIESVYNSYVI